MCPRSEIANAFQHCLSITSFSPWHRPSRVMLSVSNCYYRNDGCHWRFCKSNWWVLVWNLPVRVWFLPYFFFIFYFFYLGVKSEEWLDYVSQQTHPLLMDSVCLVWFTQSHMDSDPEHKSLRWLVIKVIIGTVFFLPSLHNGNIIAVDLTWL